MKETVVLIIVALLTFILGVKLMNYGQKIHRNKSIKSLSLILKTGYIFVYFSITILVYSFSLIKEIRTPSNRGLNSIEYKHLLETGILFHDLSFLPLCIVLFYALWVLKILLFQKKT